MSAPAIPAQIGAVLGPATVTKVQALWSLFVQQNVTEAYKMIWSAGFLLPAAVLGTVLVVRGLTKAFDNGDDPTGWILSLIFLCGGAILLGLSLLVNGLARLHAPDVNAATNYYTYIHTLILSQIPAI